MQKENRYELEQQHVRSDYDNRSWNMSWTSSFLRHWITLTRSARTIIVLALILYLINRFIFSLDLLLPWKSLRYHLNDLCGGILFPFYADAICTAVTTQRLVTSVPRALLLAAICSICWEVLAPLFLPYSTGDALDALAYVIGIIMYQQAMRQMNPRDQ